MHVFAYGSLLFEPELPAALSDSVPATLCGYRRAFNKISRRRATPCTASFAAFPEVAETFCREGRNLSLALGTEESVGQGICGRLQSYPVACAAELLTRLDEREGFSENRPLRENGYVRAEVVIELETGPVTSITYLTNPQKDCVWTLPPETDLALRAKILINATPIKPGAGLARGLDYLERTRVALRRNDIKDLALETLAKEVLRFPGPWQDRLTLG